MQTQQTTQSKSQFRICVKEKYFLIYERHLLDLNIIF